MEGDLRRVIAHNIRALRKRANLIQEDFGKRVGVSKQQVHRWESKENRPSDESIKTIAENFGISALDLYKPNAFDNADPPESFPAFQNPVWLPVVSEVRAGLPKEVIWDSEERILSDMQWVRGGPEDFFWVRVEGDSMRDKMASGDLVLVRRQPFVEPGEIAVVDIEGEGV